MSLPQPTLLDNPADSATTILMPEKPKVPPGLELRRTLAGHKAEIAGLAWAPDGKLLASGSVDNTVRIWAPEIGKQVRVLKGHYGIVWGLAWSPDSKLLASCSGDRTVRIWNPETGKELRVLKGHGSLVLGVAWSADGKSLASCSPDQTVRVWSPETGKQTVLEGHTEPVLSLSFSSDSSLLCSKARNEVRVWRIDTFETVAVLNEPGLEYWTARGIAFHPSQPVLALTGEKDTVIRIWDLDIQALLGRKPEVRTGRYRNAKVVLVGDTGVGKTGLGLVLTREKFRPTESTHSRHVWKFDTQVIKLDHKRKETRETLLWDLAGQAGYRLILQLSLNEVAVALVLFDARSETDPFAGVHHWDRALRTAARAQQGSGIRMKKFLVAARTDRGGPPVSKPRIEALTKELGFDRYFETSAREGWDIPELAQAIKQAIDWEALPEVSSTELFQQIKRFLVSEKEAGRLLSTEDDLYRALLRTGDAPEKTPELRAQFATCITLVESRGLVRRLSFGNLVLLQPELLDAYASAMVNAARKEAHGLGSIPEPDALAGRFKMSKDERVKDKKQEELLLIAMVEELLRYEIALRERDDLGPHLVFPSQFTRENPDIPDPPGKAVAYGFQGPVLNLYATLAVRLWHSGMFKDQELWKNAVVYKTRARGECGMFLKQIEEGKAELTLFYSEETGPDTRLLFEDYIAAHLQRRALPETIYRRRIIVCQGCGFVVSDQLLRLRQERGLDSLICPSCDTRISLVEAVAVAVEAVTVSELDKEADVRREKEAAVSVIEGKRKTGDFDVFLCHNSKDKPAVKEIAKKLIEHGILPWLDEWELRPGDVWIKELDRIIKLVKTAAVFVGPNFTGRWERLESRALLRRFVDAGLRVIPVVLQGAEEEPDWSIFLEDFHRVDFRKQEPDPLNQLIYGITGDRTEIPGLKHPR